MCGGDGFPDAGKVRTFVETLLIESSRRLRATFIIPGALPRMVQSKGKETFRQLVIPTEGRNLLFLLATAEKPIPPVGRNDKACLEFTALFHAFRFPSRPSLQWL